MSTQLGFIGVGRMGSEMAQNLIDKGKSVAVFDVDEQKVQTMSTSGAKETDSVQSLVEECEIVFSSLPRGRHVEDVYLGKDGVVDSLNGGEILIEMSTVKPESIRAIEQEVENSNRDASVLDSPVIGVPSTARRGELTVLVGGSEKLLEQVSPYLEILGQSIEHVGSVGQAKAIKLVNNVVTYGNFAIAAEAFALGDRLGIDRQELFNIIDSGAAHSSIVRSKMPHVFEKDYKPRFTVDGACKDLRYALDLDDCRVEKMPIAEKIIEQYRYAAKQGADHADYSALVPILSEDDTWEDWKG